MVSLEFLLLVAQCLNQLRHRVPRIKMLKIFTTSNHHREFMHNVKLKLPDIMTNERIKAI